MKHGFEEYLDCNSYHFVELLNNPLLQFHKHNQVLTAVQSAELHSLQHTSFALEVQEHYLLQEVSPDL